MEEVVELNAKRITTLGISLAGGDQLQPQVHEGGDLQQLLLLLLLLLLPPPPLLRSWVLWPRVLLGS